LTRTALQRSWFVLPPLRGKWAIGWGLLSLPAAALIRSSMDCPDAIGECCTPFFVLVLLTAILLGFLPAVATAIGSAAVSLLLYSPTASAMPMQMAVHSDGEFWGMALFFFYCAIIIGAVEFARRSFARYSRIYNPQESSSGVIFSLEDGQAWASWPGSPSPVRLGPEHEVTVMMHDFIAQVELGQRLAERTDGQAGSKTLRRASALSVHAE
jgi:hypothetical protein